MTVETEEYSSARRRLILRDSMTFLGLVLVTAVLFAITLFLFRSFMAHRQELAQDWSDRGRAAIRAGHPDQAVIAFRTALSYAPDERSYELLLAQALGDSGSLDESYNYFQGLWETTPGDGFINLRLARLAAKKEDRQAAINYYRSAIYGTWEGDGTVRRREVRLELSRYLIAQHDANGARSELLIAGGNNPNDVGVALTLADLFQRAGAPRDALNYYEKALAMEPANEAALEGAGRLQYESGKFDEAYKLLERAAHEHGAAGAKQADLPAELDAMRGDAERILAMAPSNDLPSGERVARILKIRDVAKNRFDSCSTQAATASSAASSLAGLGGRWSGKEGTINRAGLLKDPDEQDAVVQLIFDTETETSQMCGPPKGDDALLMLLARSPHRMEP
jgi:Tfp pilus assembly protein PilF